MKRQKLQFVLFILLGFTIFQAQGQVVINEYSASNLSDYVDNFGGTEDWIELYNKNDIEVDLSGYYLSDKASNPTKWQMPEGLVISAGGFLRFWTSGRDTVLNSNYHTNFKLKQTKSTPEVIIFSDADGEILEQIDLYITQSGNSYGRTADGGDSWSVFTSPSNGESNNNSDHFDRYAAKPNFSITAGFFPSTQTVEISTTEPNANIYYTTNGFEPTVSSLLYTEPLTIDETTIVKAKVISNESNILPSFIDFHTYFINETFTLPVFSIASDKLEILLNDIDKEARPIGSMEFFDNNTFIENGYGEFNSHGQDSWVNDQRSIDYITRDEMGYANAIHQKLFDLSPREEFQRIILRAEGDDNYPAVSDNPGSTHLRDQYIQKLSNMADLHLDERKSERCIVYVNGKYWGVYSIREKVDDPDFMKYYYDQDKYHIDFIMIWGSTWVEYGDESILNDWKSFANFILSQDMSIPANFEFVKERYDYKSLVDYVLINSYVVCSDWLNWNLGWWRGTDPDGEHKKWGYILWDEDATFGHYINYTGIPNQEPDIEPCYPDNLVVSDWEGYAQDHIDILNKLKENPEFSQYYISRYVDLMNTYFSCDTMLTLLDREVAKIEPEMQRHIDKWGGTFSEWESNVQDLRDFITTRCNFVAEGLNDCYNLQGPYNINFNVQPENAGKIKVNSLEFDNFPMSGSYHGGIDVLLEAIETQEEWEFDKWLLNNHEVYPSINMKDVVLNLTTTDTIIAVFKERSTDNELVINEINYKSADDFDTKDWVEFYNPVDSPMDISNWVFKDSNDDNEFIFPEGTVIEPDSFLVLCRNTSAFSELHPNVTNIVGEMEFKLSNSDELIRLYDNFGILIDTVHYYDEDPWPTDADGFGPTLQLISPDLDNALAASWEDYSGHGTPGKSNGVSVGTNNLEYIVSITISPNPMQNSAIIEFSTKLKNLDGNIIIYNILGKQVDNIQVQNESKKMINRNNLPNGLYILKLFDSKSNEIIGSTKLILD